MKLNAAQTLIQSWIAPPKEGFLRSVAPPHRPFPTRPKLRWEKNRGEKKRAARDAANEKERQRQKQKAERYPTLAFSFGSVKDIGNG